LDIDNKSDSELKAMAGLAYNAVSARYTLENFEKSVRHSIETIINEQ